MSENPFEKHPEPESEKMPHRGQELSNLSARALKLIDAWLQRKKSLQASLQQAIQAGNTEMQKRLEGKLAAAEEEIAEGLRVARGIGQELDRDAKARVMLNEAIKKVEQNTDKNEGETHE
ncbi:hypothetical protein KGO95_02235 [Patescibacteria group bacterium]|nr:hypothetical protein [Patescibacteria group bacterium]